MKAMLYYLYSCAKTFIRLFIGFFRAMHRHSNHIANQNVLFTLLSIVLISIVACDFSRTEKAIPRELLEETMKGTTVHIQGQGQIGTGFIIKEEINENSRQYTVMTARHVINVQPGSSLKVQDPLPDEKKFDGASEDPYILTVYDSSSKTKTKDYPINYATVKKDPKLDIAIFSFISLDRQYPVTKLSASLKQKQDIFLYGFKNCHMEQSFMKKSSLSTGKILGVEEKVDDQGYQLSYTNATISGMSGSPVFDSAGRVIGIHGKPGKVKIDGELEQSVLRNCNESIPDSFKNNYGIPMNLVQSSNLFKDLNISFANTPIQ
jgi:Trypsin-like peptidase domain